MGSLDSLDSAKGTRKGVLQQQQKMSNSTTELFTEGKFSYHVLTPAHKDAAHAVLARAFCSEPACSDVAEVRPDMKTEYIDWLEFVDYWMDHCSTNGLSVVALDKENSRVAGVFIVRDLLMVPPGFDDKYKSETKTLSPWMGFLWQGCRPLVPWSSPRLQGKQDRELPDQGCDEFAEEIQLQVRDN